MEDLPDDVLREIFVYCLPDDRLHAELQPNTKIAPMLLCQVCSRWRALALALSGLWTHLHICLPIQYYVTEDRLGTPRPAELVRNVEFLSWWRENSHLASPFLHITNFQEEDDSISFSRSPTPDFNNLGNDTLEFLLEYMSSAEYICIVDTLYVHLMKAASLNNFHRQVFPNPRTLSVQCASWIISMKFYQDCVDPILSQEGSNLRRLHIGDITELLCFESEQDAFANWTALTHMRLTLGESSITTWYRLLQSLPNLQCGHFSIASYDIFEDEDDHDRPHSQTFLPCLLYLFIRIFGDHIGTISNPIALLLENVQMPDLDELFLHQDAGWTSERIKTDLYPILNSTTKLTFLSLGKYIPSFITPEDAEVTPIISYVPNLTTVYIVWDEIFEYEGNKSLISEQFFDHLFSSNHWLHLSSQNCPIRKVFIEIEMILHLSNSENSETNLERQDDWVEKKLDIIRRSVAEGIRKHAAEAPAVIFHVKLGDGDGVGMNEAKMADQIIIF